MPTNFSTSIFGTTAAVDDLFVTADAFRQGNLWTWGRNSYGQLGTNTTTQRNTPVTTLAGGANWKQVTGCHLQAMAAIKTDGTLWTWGRNYAGRLGDNTTTDRSTPVTTFAGGTNWKQVAGGYNFTAIKTDGTLWTWGSNANGTIGDNTTTNRLTPVTTFAGVTNWKQSTNGDWNTAAIKTDGTLWIWGIPNGAGINQAFTNRLTPVTTFAGGTNWKQVVCGYRYTAAIKTDGTLWTWGFNSYGQVGDNTTTQRLTPVTTFAGGTNWKQIGLSARAWSVSAIKTDGTLWTWGYNATGQLGDNTATTRSTPVTTFAGGTNWKQVFFIGATSAAAVKTDGTLWTWGQNSTGQLGNNTTTTRSTPVTTFAGGTNWKQVAGATGHTAATTYIDDYQ